MSYGVQVRVPLPSHRIILHWSPPGVVSTTSNMLQDNLILLIQCTRRVTDATTGATSQDKTEVIITRNHVDKTHMGSCILIPNSVM